jgi:hypothetical protein
LCAAIWASVRASFSHWKTSSRVGGADDVRAVVVGDVVEVDALRGEEPDAGGGGVVAQGAEQPAAGCLGGGFDHGHRSERVVRLGVGLGAFEAARSALDEEAEALGRLQRVGMVDSEGLVAVRAGVGKQVAFVVFGEHGG